MPGKVPFRVIHVSGQDDGYKAVELNTHSPTTKGWQSSRFCLFPQDIVIQMEKRSRLRKIQILSHQFLIPTKIEFYVGDVPNGMHPNLQNARYTRLGYVALSDNAKTQFKARELKSVHVDAIGCFIKFVIHKNHINKHNIYNQVGLVAINVIGDDLTKSKTINDMTVLRQKLIDEGIYTEVMKGELQDSYSDPTMAGIINKPDFISPLDDLAFDMYQDPEVAGIIRKLEKKKQEAVLQERYDFAKKLKDAVATLQKVGERLGKFEVEKRQAVETEDYEKAKLKKTQMEEYRFQMYKQLELEDLLELAGARHQKQVDLDPSRQPTPPRLTEIPNAPLPPTPHEDPPPRTPYDERPLPAIKSKPTTPNAGPSPLSVQPSSPEPSSIQLPPPETVDQHPSSRTDKQNTEASKAESPVPYDERPLPASKKDEPETDPEPEKEEREEPAESKPTTRPLRAPKNTAQKVVRPPKKENSTEVETLSAQDQREAAQAIEVFELSLVSKAYSKTWSFREEALTEVEGRMMALQSSAPKEEAKAMMRAAIFLVTRALKDKVYAVFTTAIHLLRYILTEYIVKHKIPKSDTAYAVERTLQPLIQKSGDTAVRNREAAKQHIVEESKYPEVKPLHVVTSECVKPFKLTIAPRLALSRTEIVSSLYQEHGLQNSNEGKMAANDKKPRKTNRAVRFQNKENSGLTLDSMMKFCTQALQHTSGEVREKTEKIIIDLYKECGAPVKTYLPPDDDKTRKNVLYKQLFEAFDRIDGKPSKEELKRRRQDEEKAKQKEIEALQQQLQALKDMAAGKAPIDETALSDPAPKKKPAKTLPKQKSKKEKSDPTPDPVIDEDSSTMFQMEHTCIFCGERDENFTEEGLDIHYWKSCPMLKRCSFCKQVVEIAGLSDHYLSECEAKDNFSRCPRCTEAINNAEFDQHVQEKSCNASEAGKSHCPLCHQNFTLGEDGWKNHLMGKDGCKANPRRLQSLSRQEKSGSRGTSKGATPKAKSQVQVNSAATWTTSQTPVSIFNTNRRPHFNDPNTEERTKKLRINTGVLRRTVKEKEMYVKEVAGNERTLDTMYEELRDELEIKKQQELIDESRQMVADSDRRIKKAYRDLEDIIEEENMVREDQAILHTKEYREAIELLSEVKNKMDANE